MQDDPVFRGRNLPLLHLVEVKAGGPCRLNGPWTNPESGNLARVLSAIGCYEPEEVDAAADALYKHGAYKGGTIETELVAVAERRSNDLAQAQPRAVQLVWDDVLQFIFDRFRLFRAQKANHPRWDPEGHELYELMEGAQRDSRRFKGDVRERFFRPGV